MDNAYFIGYRIDLDIKADPWDVAAEAEKYGADPFPNSEWYSFSKVGGGVSLLWMDKDYADYRCPIDRDELWEDLHRTTFDFPDNGPVVFEAIQSSKLWQHLVEKYGLKKIEVRWGVFLCLS